MDIVQEALNRYRREYDFYDQAARFAAQLLDSEFQASGIRALVTSRAKKPERLEQKIRQRNISNKYQNVDDIFADIVDLAGVRVALYFPGERENVGKKVESIFDLIDIPKLFPKDAAQPKYSKKFSGYSAIHYRVRIKESILPESQKRYAGARIEIQVASVLMHAWSEVEHDLVYKPLQGNLSDDEYAILDELNGLVLTGEIALERLQRAGEVRVAKQGTKFLNHYDLGAFLYEYGKKLNNDSLTDYGLGRVDELFDLLERLNLNSPKSLKNYMSSITSDIDSRPIVEQIVDQILMENTERYEVYSEIHNARELQKSYQSNNENKRSYEQLFALDFFLKSWVSFDHFFVKFEQTTSSKARRNTITRINLDNYLDEQDKNSFHQLRKMRNLIVHGIETPSSNSMIQAANDVFEIINHLSEHKDEAIRTAAIKALDYLLTVRTKMKVIKK